MGRPRHPVLEAMERAPLVHKLTPEQRDELDKAMEDIAAGRVQLVANEDVPAWMEERERRGGLS